MRNAFPESVDFKIGTMTKRIKSRYKIITKLVSIGVLTEPLEKLSQTFTP